MFLLAERLGTSIETIKRMPVSEFFDWYAFYAYREDEREFAAQKQDQSSWRRAY